MTTATGPRAALTGLVGSCHPKPVVGMTLLAGGLAAAYGYGPRTVLVAGAVLTAHASIGWLNDLADADRDRATGRTDKPLAAGRVPVRAVRLAFLVAAMACVPLSLASGLVAGGLHLLSVAAGWAYDLGLKSTPASLLCHVVAFLALPMYLVLGMPRPPAVTPWWLVAGMALLGCAMHFVNVLRDLDGDAATGVRGLPQLVGAAGSRVAAGLLVLAAAVVVGRNAPVPEVVAVGLPVGAAVVLAAGHVLGRDPMSRAPFRAVTLVAVLVVAAMAAAGPVVSGAATG